MPARLPTLILASASPYRRELLERLGLPFEARAANVDERAGPREDPRALAGRLARAKAEALDGVPGALVIGSDQTVDCGGRLLGKPGDRQRAGEQLRAQSGRTVSFHTGLCLLDSRNGETRETVETVRVVFRELTDDEIERYLDRDRPFDCAGSFKSESLGVALCERIECEDPTALIGLPLIRLSRMLRDFGFDLP